MKHSFPVLPARVLAVVSITIFASNVVADEAASPLEPCINGGVSASGLYENQAHEDIALLNQTAPSEDFAEK